ncbi:MAG: transcription antitermination protein NusB [Candidatus Petromonas sp.]|jgi:N utilization substance protein B|nr:transcription antitermination protein NusB [Candidatus Petromonas sp.]
MSRRIARETVMQVFYQMEIQKSFDSQIAQKFVDGVIVDEKDRQYVDDIVKFFLQNKSIIDGNISHNLKDWDIDRISKVDLSILRVAATEILFKEDIPEKVSINEAVELAKRYGSDDSPAFINGVLDALSKTKG